MTEKKEVAAYCLSLKDSYEDLLEAGIIEPAKVLKAALQNAVSVAMMVLTAEALVAEVEKKEEK